MLWASAAGKVPSLVPTVKVPDCRYEYVCATGGAGGSGVAGSRAPTSGLALGHCCTTGDGATCGSATTGPAAGTTTGTGASGKPGCTGSGGIGLAGAPLSRVSGGTLGVPAAMPWDGG